MALLEEMRGVSRDGDTIGSQGARRDDRTFAMAQGIRAWEEKIRRSMILSNQTRQAEAARLSVSITDQRQLFDSNMLTEFFARKAALRIQTGRTQMRQDLRRAARMPASWRR